MKNTRIIFTFTIKYIFPNKITNYNINLQNHIPSNNLKINPTNYYSIQRYNHPMISQTKLRNQKFPSLSLSLSILQLISSDVKSLRKFK